MNMTGCRGKAGQTSKAGQFQRLYAYIIAHGRDVIVYIQFFELLGAGIAHWLEHRTRD